jgi:hypothetical protein
VSAQHADLVARCNHVFLDSSRPNYDLKDTPIFCARPQGHSVEEPFDCHEDGAGDYNWPDVPVVVCRLTLLRIDGPERAQ